MPLPLGAMLVTVSFAMPHGTCSSTTARGPQLPTPALMQGWATVALQLLVNYKSHHASAFGSHACNCQFCNASWDL
ncbi:unnamed protein product [Staurois parvus]|uniref:Secreted protein n=1 Tax=Staurois parvus TaxID=386267 RepID=A0ABN9FXJ1_9NEOB|nr:unnamed protein product [Staurois parvus]